MRTLLTLVCALASLCAPVLAERPRLAVLVLDDAARNYPAPGTSP